MTQNEAILKALEQGEKLTPLDALRRFGCMRLGARIWDLKQKGIDVKAGTLKVAGDKHVAVYWLEKQVYNTNVPQGANYSFNI